MRKVAVFTGSRAEYGLLYWLLKAIQETDVLQLQVIVSGMHLSPEFGLTYKYIEEDGFKIDAKVEMMLSSDTPCGIAKSIGLGTLGFADALTQLKPDILVLLGDRFEALAIAQTAMILRIPIVHIHGGEVTEGAYDDAIRHAITKMSMIHCTATEAYRQRVIQLGEAPERVMNVGAVGLDYINYTNFLSMNELSTRLSFQFHQPFFLVTYHPATLVNEAPEVSLSALLEALDAYQDYQVVITYANADDGGRRINDLIKTYADQRVERVLASVSLGHLNYLSLMKHAVVVIGNSSSGIIEAPSFGVPSVNIGDRQKGRISASSVNHCGTGYEDIVRAIELSISQSQAEMQLPIINPYGQGDASGQILEILKTMSLSSIKTFYDLNVNVD